MMVLTVAQVTAFFEGTSQMAMPHNARAQLKSEGLIDPSDLVDFTEEAMAMISQNLRRPGGGSKIQILMLTQEPLCQRHLSCLELKVRFVS